MSKPTFDLTRAVTRGRAPRVQTRENILAGLLRQRAAANLAGETVLESRLREQIRWALPVRYPKDADEPVE